MTRRNKGGKPSEDVEQMALMRWTVWKADVFGGDWELLRLLYHIPNGGARSRAEGGIFKAMGVKAGVPDLFLPVQRLEGGSSRMLAGLYIEMKAEGGRLRPNQREWLEELRAQGYACAVCHGAEEAEQAIEQYMERRFVQAEHTF